MALKRIDITPEQNIVGTVTHAVKKELSGYLNGDPVHLRIDLKHVTMIDSLGIGVLVATRNRLKESGSEFSIRNLSQDLTQLFSNMKIIEFLHIE